MNASLSPIDVAVLVGYVVAVVALGCYFVRQSGTTEAFTAANRSLSGWTVGLSLIGTNLSSITFLSFPEESYLNNWNSAVTLIAAVPVTWLVVHWIVPLHRRSRDISAYSHLEQRFGPWARNYATSCFVILQIGRIGAVMYLVSVAMHSLLGWDVHAIIVTTGLLVTIYSLLGGFEAVIWTDVMQTIVLSMGALVCVVLLVFGMPEGPGQIFEIARTHNKFSLGEFGPSLAEKTFWVMLVYAVFRDLALNLTDQNKVQRFKSAKSVGEAQKSVWLLLLYVPLALMFFFIGTALFAFYQAQPELLPAQLRSPEMAEGVFPHFIVAELPAGVTGLLIAALFAAAMSSVDSSLNSSATLILTDFQKRYINRQAGERESMRVLRESTLVLGVLGTATAIGLHYTQQGILETWWAFEAVLTGTMFGLMLLGLLSYKADNFEAATALTIGSLVALWVSFSPYFSEEWAFLRSPFHKFMAVVLGTSTIFLVGVMLSARNTPKEK